MYSIKGLQLWQYRLWSFQGRDTTLERFVAKNQLKSNEIIQNFDNWSRELSKVGLLENKVI